MPGVDGRRARSFGRRAALYDRVRPSYPPEAVTLLAAGPGRRVVDVGAGTGKLTRPLVDAGCEVLAIDPDPGMLAVLTERLPGVPACVAVGESLPVRDGWADRVVYGQAWHWVQSGAAAAEASRVLGRDGELAMLWNYEAEATGWLAELDRIAGPPQQDQQMPGVLAGFAGVQVQTLTWTREQRVALLPDFVLSHSWIGVLRDAEQEAVLAAVGALAREHPDLRAREQVRVSMRVQCWRYRRRS